MPSETDYAYLAGLIDGEGCFMVGNSGTIFMRISSVTLWLLEEMQKQFGGTIHSMQAPKKATHQQCYTWHIQGPELGEVSHRVVTYMHYRKCCMELVCQYYGKDYTYHDPRKAIAREAMRKHLKERMEWIHND